MKEAPGIGAVGADAANNCGEMNENIRVRFLVQPQYLGFFAEVVVAAARNGYFPAAASPDLPTDKQSREAAATADNYAPIRPKTHLAPLMLRSLTADGLHHARDRIMPTIPVADFLLQNDLAFSAWREACRFNVRIHHDGHQIAESDSRLPTQLRARFAGIRDEHVHFQGPQVTIGHLDVLLPIQACIGERGFDKFAHRMRFTGPDYEIIGGILLQHLPDGFHVFG